MAVLGLFFLAGPGRAENAFISGFDDLPLMPGMTESSGQLMTFDSPGGRIVENSTHGKLTRPAVLKFYRQTLPQLGWARTGPGVFVREGEILRLEFSPGQDLTVQFILKPIE